MKNMTAIRSPVWNGELCVTGKSPVIKIGHRLSCFYIFIKMLQFYIQYSRLQGVKPAIATHHFIVISFALAMIGDHFHFISKRVIISENGTAVTVSTEIF